MLKRWIPWNYLVKSAARRYDIIDPLTLMARLRRFAQPSEVQEPIELLRAGIVFHARGLVNTKAIQHNLDWIWPYWVVRQFDPTDPSFIPRAFSFSHINLTHRNWTAVSHRHFPLTPIVDPRGLVTPLYDGWSLDAWIVTADGENLYPSRLEEVDQKLLLEENLAVVTRCRHNDMHLSGRVSLEKADSAPLLHWQLDASGPPGSFLVVSLRPYNPEGIQFIETASYDEKQCALSVNDHTQVRFSVSPDRVCFSNYEQGDVSQHLFDESSANEIKCKVGMATVAAIFPVSEGTTSLRTRIDLSSQLEAENKDTTVSNPVMPERKMADTAGLEIPDKDIKFLYDAAIRTLDMLSINDVFPGPYTYKRFWFRDACLMIHALLCAGFEDRAFACLHSFPGRQKHSGYFLSQQGEWDSNGQVLWIFERSLELSGRPLPEHWHKAIWKAVDWIGKKREKNGKEPHSGLFPPGFSAEHFGPNDYYYWDDFWGAAGLKAAARLAERAGNEKRAAQYRAAADDFIRAIWDSIEGIPPRRSQGAVPASPYRRMDAGAIGCLVADYPLQMVPAGHDRIIKTVNVLQEKCFLKGAFFQDMIHSGINPYLTLTVAQTLLRNGDDRYKGMIRRVAELASPTGQWPEAVHPLTGGGCMGDGQHGWAAAEWVMMIRNMFVREEDNRVILGSGIFPEWLKSKETLEFGPTPTAWGPVSVQISKRENKLFLKADVRWRNNPPQLETRLPGYQRFVIENPDEAHLMIPESP